MTIRKASPDDLEAIRRIAREAFRKLKTMGYDGPRHKEDFRHFLQSDDFLTLVYEEEEILGFIMLRVKNVNRRFRFDRLDEPPIDDPEACAYIMYIAVDPKHQGRGIGKRLFKAALNEAKKMGKKCLFGEFTTASPAAIRLAESFGGREIVADVRYVFDL